MLLGLSRAAWIGYGIAMILLIVMTRRGLRAPVRIERTGVILLTFVLAVVMLGSIAANVTSASSGTSVLGGITAKFANLTNVTSGTGHQRINELNTALTDVKTSPIIGLGANTYGIHHPPVIASRSSKNSYIGNVWLRALYESGIVGLALLFGGLLRVLWPSASVTGSRGELAPIARALVFAGITLAIAYLGTDDTLYMWPWILWGLARAARVLADRELVVMRRAGRIPSPELVEAYPY